MLQAFMQVLEHVFMQVLMQSHMKKHAVQGSGA
jgi:hypothetical protein